MKFKRPKNALNSKLPRSKESELRIIAGKFRGQKILAPANGLTHPMGSREKNALFNALLSRLGGDFSSVAPEALTSSATPGNTPTPFRVLDLYAGSGALGLEALSRGASEVVFVENNPTALAAIRENIQRLDASSKTDAKNETVKTTAMDPVRTEVIKADATKFLDTQFSLIFIDPPYGDFPTQLETISAMLAPGGLVALSHPKEVNPETFLPGLKLFTTKSHARSRLSILTK